MASRPTFGASSTSQILVGGDTNSKSVSESLVAPDRFCVQLAPKTSDDFRSCDPVPGQVQPIPPDGARSNEFTGATFRLSGASRVNMRANNSRLGGCGRSFDLFVDVATSVELLATICPPLLNTESAMVLVSGPLAHRGSRYTPSTPFEGRTRQPDDVRLVDAGTMDGAGVMRPSPSARKRGVRWHHSHVDWSIEAQDRRSGRSVRGAVTEMEVESRLLYDCIHGVRG